MIDIHSHILPAVDDGSQTLATSLDMLRKAIDGGVTTQVLTPHIHIGRYENTKESLARHFKAFKQQVVKANLSINLRLASEVRIGPELMAMAVADSIPYLGLSNNKKVFLLEFPRVDIPYGSENLIRWLLDKGYLPLIVHPERNSVFIRNNNKLQTLIDLGCPLQVTASSLTGKFGSEVQSTTEALLKAGKVSVIASDCHNLKGRAPDLYDGYAKAVSVIGEIEANKLVNENPLSFIGPNS